MPSLIRFFVLIVGFVSLIVFSANAQVERPVKAPRGALPDKKPATVVTPPDTLLNEGDSLKVQADSVKQAKKEGDIETTVVYSSNDSINFNLKTRIAILYGDAKIKYGQIELEAEQVEIDYSKSIISAHGKLDSLGRKVGYPIFKDGTETYETKDMRYNFKTKNAKITEVVTQQGDGFLHGEAVFKNDKNELFSLTNAYTTCNLEHPHFRILSHRSKALPGDKIVTGPFHMEFNGVPTPLGFLFGIFPSKQKSNSGIIFPKYGEEGVRGFFLKGGGYFFDINDYVKTAVTGDVYSRGSTAVTINTVYRDRYKYSGNLNFTYTSNKASTKIEETSRLKDFRLTWSHSPQSRGTGRFSASVNAATSKYNSNNLLNLNSTASSTRIDNTTRKLSSNISYSKSFNNTPISMGVNLRHNQDLTTNQIDVPFPDVSLNVNNIYPFKHANGNEFLENMSIRYTMTATNQVTNNLGKIGKKKDASGNLLDSIAPFTFQNIPQLFKNAKKGVRSNIPWSTSVKVLKHFTLSPSINYNELWYFEKYNWKYSTDSTKIVADTLQGFNRVNNYSGSISMTTRLYGMYVNKNPKGKLKAIRHVVNPSISYTFQPDFADPKYGYYQTFNRVINSNDVKGKRLIVQKANHEGFIYGTSPTGRSSAVGFGINNNIEMKVQGKDDSVARKVSLLNTLSVSSSYNFAADSFKLANFSLSANTNILNDKVNINVSAVVDPYQYRIDSIVGEKVKRIYETRVSRYLWDKEGKLGQITSANLAFGTNLSPKGQKKDTEMRKKVANANGSESDKEFLLKNPDAYIDFTIPWNLRINYNVDYTKSGHQKAKITQALRFNGDVSLSEKWKVGFNSGLDLQLKQITQTNISINRELHCFQMSLNWVPFGKFQSYTFFIGIKSSMLSSLKLDRQRTFFDN